MPVRRYMRDIWRNVLLFCPKRPFSFDVGKVLGVHGILEKNILIIKAVFEPTVIRRELALKRKNEKRVSFDSYERVILLPGTPNLNWLSPYHIFRQQTWRNLLTNECTRGRFQRVMTSMSSLPPRKVSCCWSASPLDKFNWSTPSLRSSPSYIMKR